MAPRFAQHPLDLSGAGVVRQHPEGSAALSRLVVRCGERPGSGTALREAARRRIAALVRAAPEEVVLTSGGAEACNAGLKGLALAALAQAGHRRRIVLSVVEHAPVYHAARSCERLGFDLRLVAVDAHGSVDLDGFRRALSQGAALAALQWANDETGVVQPISAAAAAAREAGVPLMVDATAAAGWVEVNLQQVPAAALALSARRMGGPPGAGALVLRRGTRWVPLIEGGFQEEGRRAGVQHPALAAAFGLSAAAATRRLEARARRAARHRELLARALRRNLPQAILLEPEPRLPGHLPVRLAGASGEALLVALARRGIEADSGAACAEGPGVPSRILRATGLSPAEAAGSLLFRFSAGTPPGASRRVARLLASTVARLRELAP